jgi:hypothetical protein
MLAASVLAAAAARAAELPEGPYTVRSAASGKCLDLSQASAADGQAVLLWECHGGTNQSWYLETAAAGDKQGWTLRSALDRGKCLDVAARGGAGTQLIVWSCSGGDNQTFLTALAHRDPEGHDWLTVSAAFNGLCLDVQGGASDNGTPIIVWTCSAAAGAPAAPNQLWSLRPQSP